MDERKEPKIIARVRALIWEIASREYPLVWVGKPGMREEKPSEFRKMNKELPEYMRAEPGEFVGLREAERAFRSSKREVPG